MKKHKKYCVFRKDIYGVNQELIYHEEDKVLITYEDETAYYFGDPVNFSISKKLDNKLYDLVM